MEKKKIIILTIILLLIILTIVGFILKPKYELDKSVKYVKEGNYTKAYTYINSKRNEDNIKIIKELISLKLVENMSKGLEQITTIANKGTEILNKTNINNINYSLDDTLNIYVNKLEDYINIKENISKEMIIEDMYETYDLYFEVLKFVNENFFDMLNNISKINFINEVLSMSSKLETIGVNIKSITDNYNYSLETKELYKELIK